MIELCRHDPVADTLRNVFHANIVEVPEARIQPLIVVAASQDRTSFRGAILPLLKKPTNFAPPQIMQSQMPAVSGTKTRQVTINLGLEILGNFLQGFGVPSAGLSASFQGATAVSFSFNDVIRFFVDVGELGEHLIGSVLNSDNPAAAIFFEPDHPYSCYILDSSISSSDFTIAVEKAQDSDFKIDVPTISQVVSAANAGVQVTTSSNVSVSFKGDRHLGFAFSCLLANLDDSGRITSLEPGGDIPQFGLIAGTNVPHVVSHTPDHVLLTKTPAMLAADFSEFASA